MALYCDELISVIINSTTTRTHWIVLLTCVVMVFGTFGFMNDINTDCEKTFYHLMQQNCAMCNGIRVLQRFYCNTSIVTYRQAPPLREDALSPPPFVTELMFLNAFYQRARYTRKQRAPLAVFLFYTATLRKCFQSRNVESKMFFTWRKFLFSKCKSKSIGNHIAFWCCFIILFLHFEN